MKISVDIPDSKIGAWKISTFVITKEDAEFHNIRSMFSSGPTTNYEPGTYKRLTRNGQTIMSNTPDEIGDHISFIHAAKGSVLINGLGLGVCLSAILKKTEVNSVVVVEKEADVINLVGSHFTHPMLTIIHANALEYKPPKNTRYDVVWHDIWDNICTDNLETMATLHRKYGRRCGWQSSWKRDYLKFRKRIEEREDRKWGHGYR